jgi:DNA-binding CsgD family transcriptional regulator
VDGSLLLGRVTARLGVLCNSIYQCDKAGPLLETALAIFRRLDARAEIAFALSRLGEVIVYQGTLLRARRLFDEALAISEEIGDVWGQAFASNWLGSLSGGPEARMQQRAHSLKLYQEMGSQWGIAVETPMLGFSVLDTENYQEAMRLGQEGLARCQEIGIRWGVVMSLFLLGAAAHGLEDDYTAIQYFTCSLEESLELRLDRQLMMSAFGAARVLDALGRSELAAAFDTVAYHYYAGLPGETHFIHTDALGAERLAAVRVRHTTIEPEAEIERLIVELHAVQPAAQGTAQPLISPLTERELEILARVSAGMANRDIAGELYLSTGTVKWYLSQIYGKLGVSSRTQAVARARELQLID